MPEEPEASSIDDVLDATYRDRTTHVRTALAYTADPDLYTQATVDFNAAYFASHIRYVGADLSRMAPETTAVADFDALLEAKGVSQQADRDAILAKWYAVYRDNTALRIYRIEQETLDATPVPEEAVKGPFVSEYEAQMEALRLTTDHPAHNQFAIAEINIEILVSEVAGFRADHNVLAEVSESYAGFLAGLDAADVADAGDQAEVVEAGLDVIEADLGDLYAITAERWGGSE